MFQENPFSGACAASTYEVLAMLLGTLLLGLLLGFLIWGWLKREVSVLRNSLSKYKHIADLRSIQTVDLTTRIFSLKDELERVETKVKLAEYRLRRVQDELETAKEKSATVQQDISHHQASTATEEFNAAYDTIHKGTDLVEPTLADISLAMKAGTVDEKTANDIDPTIDQSQLNALHRGITDESLELARKVFDQKIDANDLKIISGIDSNLEELLHQSGIQSWSDLALSYLPDLRKVIQDAGPGYANIDPKTWATQARMAAKGEWKKLKAYQEALLNA